MLYGCVALEEREEQEAQEELYLQSVPFVHLLSWQQDSTHLTRTLGGNRSHVVYLHPLLKFTFRSCFCFMDWLCVPPRILSPAFWISGSYWWQLQFLACSWAHLHPLLAPPFDNRFFFFFVVCCFAFLLVSGFQPWFFDEYSFLFAESGSEMLPGALIMQLCK